MYQRSLKKPNGSFFLFGPRGTGKSTWLAANVKAALSVSLLNTRDFLELSRDPSSLQERAAHLAPGSWVVLDEVQRVPDLLNEVHDLMEQKRLKFALSGSSARRLRRDGANLLAGRATRSNLFTLTSDELGKDFDLTTRVQWGCLPLVIQAKDPVPVLDAYVETYLKEEIAQEGIVRKLEPFARFLNVSGLMAGQTLNIENISRDAHVGRTTVDHYFGILEDTLLGFRLRAFQPALKVKETAHSKFYFFDSGVAAACAGRLREDPDPVFSGFALETLILNEVRAYNHYSGKERPLYYYRVSGSFEIDLVIETRKKTHSRPPEVVLIEMKHNRKWDRRWSEPAAEMAAQKNIDVKARYGLHLGSEDLTTHGMRVMPVPKFLRALHSGRVF